VDLTDEGKDGDDAWLPGVLGIMISRAFSGMALWMAVTHSHMTFVMQIRLHLFMNC
jgi:hypothetical protein